MASIDRKGRARVAEALVALALVLSLGSCGSLRIERETETSGRFTATGRAFTLLSIDIPRAALDIARENASDARLTNVKVQKARVTPHLGWADWLLDIIGVRVAKVSGTWGFPGD